MIAVSTGLERVLWDDNLSSLSPVPEHRLQTDISLRSAAGTPDMQYQLILHDSTLEALLRESESLELFLEQAVQDGLLTGWQTVTQLLPSRQLQDKRQDAIPDNGAIMHDVGVVVSFNSDSNELARRMNVEAAKAIKYGGLSPQEAFKFVSLNPAVQLGIADRVGSLEAGKDGDFVIWSGDPLSTFSRCEATWIDGREYFSLEKDRAHRRKIAAERKRILQKLLAPDPKKKKDDKEDEPDEAEQEPKPKARFDLRSLRAAARREHYLDLIRRGFDPDDHRCGSCGAGGAR